jgi:hypothetical protein
MMARYRHRRAIPWRIAIIELSGEALGRAASSAQDEMSGYQERDEGGIDLAP